MSLAIHIDTRSAVVVSYTHTDEKLKTCSAPSTSTMRSPCFVYFIYHIYLPFCAPEGGHILRVFKHPRLTPCELTIYADCRKFHQVCIIYMGRPEVKYMYLGFHRYRNASFMVLFCGDEIFWQQVDSDGEDDEDGEEDEGDVDSDDELLAGLDADPEVVNTLLLLLLLSIDVSVGVDGAVSVLCCFC